MSRAIFKVTSKKATELITKELKSKQRYVRAFTKKAQKVIPEIVAVSHSENSWNGKVDARGVIFSKGSPVDNKIWKELEKVIYNGFTTKTYWPKRNNKKGRELSQKLSEALKSKEFFQGEDIAKALRYDPKNKVSDVSAGMVTVNVLAFGYKKKGKDYTFMFSGYEGYKAPRGVKEMLNSEYNKLMKGNK